MRVSREKLMSPLRPILLWGRKPGNKISVIIRLFVGYHLVHAFVHSSVHKSQVEKDWGRLNMNERPYREGLDSVRNEIRDSNSKYHKKTNAQNKQKIYNFFILFFLLPGSSIWPQNSSNTNTACKATQLSLISYSNDRHGQWKRVA